MASSLPSHMKAAQITSGTFDKDIKIVQAPLPKTAKALKKNTALVKIAYSSLNPVDYKVMESPARYLLGKIPALDYSGTIIDSALPGFKAGDRVFGMTVLPSFGALAEYAVVPKDGLAHAPAGTKLEELATVGVTGLTAYQCLAPFVKSGDKVLINGGSGGVGTYGIQIAKALGCEVTATCSGANVDLCKSLGADEVIDYKSTNLVDALKTKGKQFDHIFDTVFFNLDLYWQCHHYLKPGAKFVTIGGQVSLSFVRSVLTVFLLPSWLGGGQREFKFLSAAPVPSEYEKIGQFMAEGKVKPVIESVLELEDTAQGYAKLKSHRTRGKIVVKVGGD